MFKTKAVLIIPAALALTGASVFAGGMIGNESGSIQQASAEQCVTDIVGTGGLLGDVNDLTGHVLCADDAAPAPAPAPAPNPAPAPAPQPQHNGGVHVDALVDVGSTSSNTGQGVTGNAGSAVVPVVDSLLPVVVGLDATTDIKTGKVTLAWDDVAAADAEWGVAGYNIFTRDAGSDTWVKLAVGVDGNTFVTDQLDPRADIELAVGYTTTENTESPVSDPVDAANDGLNAGAQDSAAGDNSANEEAGALGLTGDNANPFVIAGLAGLILALGVALALFIKNRDRVMSFMRNKFGHQTT